MAVNSDARKMESAIDIYINRTVHFLRNFQWATIKNVSKYTNTHAAFSRFWGLRPIVPKNFKRNVYCPAFRSGLKSNRFMKMLVKKLFFFFLFFFFSIVILFSNIQNMVTILYTQQMGILCLPLIIIKKYRWITTDGYNITKY